MNVRREGRLPDARPPDIACVQQTSLPASTSAGGLFFAPKPLGSPPARKRGSGSVRGRPGRTRANGLRSGLGAILRFQQQPGKLGADGLRLHAEHAEEHLHLIAA